MSTGCHTCAFDSLAGARFNPAGQADRHSERSPRRSVPDIRTPDRLARQDIRASGLMLATEYGSRSMLAMKRSYPSWRTLVQPSMRPIVVAGTPGALDG